MDSEILGKHGNSPGKPAISLVLPPQQTAELKGMLDSVRRGVPAAPARVIAGDGVAALLFFVQAVNLAQVWWEYLSQPESEQSLSYVMPAVLATATAGFAAAQGIGDTALKSFRIQLAAVSQEIAIKGVNVQLGKLHIGLGLLTYGFGFFASITASGAHHTEWQAALRNGNHALQQAASLSMVGSGGQVITYGSAFYPTAKAGLKVLLARNPALRLAALESFGISLSSIFARFNLYGALFTVLELVGMWLYNRHNTSCYDQWLQSTPWGRVGDFRKDLSLAEYLTNLEAIASEPVVLLGEYTRTLTWWNAPPPARERDIQLTLPSLSFNELVSSLGCEPFYALSFNACRIDHTRMLFRTVPQWHDVGPEVMGSLRVVQSSPLVLRMTCPFSAYEVGPTERELVLTVRLWTQVLNEEPHQTPYTFRLKLSLPGNYSSVRVPMPNDTYRSAQVVTGELLEYPDHE